MLLLYLRIFGDLYGCKTETTDGVQNDEQDEEGGNIK